MRIHSSSRGLSANQTKSDKIDKFEYLWVITNAWIRIPTNPTNRFMAQMRPLCSRLITGRAPTNKPSDKKQNKKENMKLNVKNVGLRNDGIIS